ncbi:phospholipase effector Tle1 domain-containing protein [Massilia pseudoviolaceinigra]|uniref:phospholipase effector Tle1 domain-containing protein n=1 Tax=Massilia pseudoviolaceinigra TaxID=3057165 RepID=UPI002796B303|nr:DUF2235 domain-containing protein [Massilia sp. CCM 9206]MDQ1922668.1 DUF2235 domain-containing protein [Massilia sp. CCM 9206]
MANNGYGNTPKVGSIDTVDVVRATAEQLGQYGKADEKISQLEVPQLYDSADPHARIFVAMFDGTGNSLANDPDNPTNIGMLSEQVQRLSDENPSIRGQYLEGPGTQKNPITRTLDGATGYTYEARMEQMYVAFQAQCAEWLKEDPNAKISLMSTGFSRGAEQAAGFSRMVHDRGITASIEMDATIPKEGSISRALGAVHKGLGKDSGLPEPEAQPPLRAPGSIPQSVVLYDPVGTGMPNLHDRRLPPSVVTGMQINAADEKRSAFPVTNNIEQGVSDDGRFVAVTVPGAHSDVGGGYKLKALSDRAFNLATNFYNKVLGHDAIRKVDISTDPDHSVIHDSTQHKIIYKKVEERGVIDLPTREAVDPVLRAQYPIKDKSADTPAPQTGAAQDKAETRSAQEGVPVRPDPAATSRTTADRAPEPAQVKSEAPRDAANRAPEPAPAKSEPPREAANRAPEPAPAKSEPPREAINRAAEPAPAKPEPPRDSVAGAVPAPATDGKVEFAKAIKAAGLELKEPPVMDGTLQRVPVAGRAADNRDGAYAGHLDGKPHGHITNFATGVQQNWSMNGVPLSEKEQGRLTAHGENARQQRGAELSEQYNNVSTKTAEKLARLPDTPPAQGNAYLERKQIDAHGVKFDGDKVVVPVRDIDGKVWSAQSIRPGEDEGKTFEKGGRRSGNMHVIGEIKPGADVLVSEGYATGASLHQATGKPVVVAFDSRNLDAVVDSVKSRHPTNPVHIMADNDKHSQQNVGVEKATAAAAKHQVGIAFPESKTPGKVSDFNDLHVREGLPAVKEQVDKAVARSVEQSLERATSVARSQHGAGIEVKTPTPDSKHTGPVTAVSGYHAVQAVNEKAVVVHQLRDLPSVPAPNKPVTIAYQEGRAQVTERAPDKPAQPQR